MKIQDIDDLITELNNEYEETLLGFNPIIPYSLTSSGYIHSILFLGEVIWNDVDDMREYLDEEQDIKEDLEVYLRREAKRIVFDLHKVVTGGNK